MLRHHRPQRPPNKPKGKFAARAQALWRLAGTGAGPVVLFFLVAGLAFARLASVAVANPAPVAVPGDMVEIGPQAMWPGGQDTIKARALPNPWAPGGPTCLLNLGDMARDGGVLTVMAVRRDGVMLSWAGGATAPYAACQQPKRGGILISAAAYEGLLVRLLPRH